MLTQRYIYKCSKCFRINSFILFRDFCQCLGLRAAGLVLKYDPEFNPLIVVSKTSPKDGYATNVIGSIGYRYPKNYVAFMVDIELFNGRIGDPFTIDEGTF